MTCPNGDGELVERTTIGENNLAVSYSRCNKCQSFWMESFAANFIKMPTDETLTPVSSTLTCPVCTKKLIRSTGENIPDTVSVYHCLDGHGYFFPSGQLTAWKQAQKAKIAYHKLWHLPLPNVGSVLLTSILIAIIGGGLLAGFSAVREAQTYSLMAKETVTSTKVFPNKTTQSALVSAQTNSNTVLTVHVPKHNNYRARMNSSDGLLHTLLIKDVPTGTYEYYFTWDVANNTLTSPRSVFSMP